MSGEAQVLADLERQAGARASGALVVSLLPRESLSLFHRHCAARSQRVAIVGADCTLPEALAAWQRAFPREALADAAETRASALAGVSRTEWRAQLAARSPVERQRTWNEHATGDADVVALWLAAGLGERESVEPAAMPLPVERSCRALCMIAPAAAPALLFEVAAAAPPALLMVAAKVAMRAADLLRPAPVAVAATAPVIASFLADAPESSSKALLRQGLVVMAVASAPAPRAGRLRGVGPDVTAAPRTPYPAPVQTGSAVHASDGRRGCAAPPAGEPTRAERTAAGAAAPGPGPAARISSADEAAPEDGRSDAERALFAALEADIRTCGKFELGGLLPVRFGDRPAEIDLLCREPPLAVEVDGFHHFREPEAYRRDRRKDVLLQQAGFLVLRVLADDVTDRPAQLVDDIASALQHLRAREEQT